MVPVVLLLDLPLGIVLDYASMSSSSRSHPDRFSW